MSRALPDILRTERLVLRQPGTTDGRAIFEAYAQDLEVTRYLIWRPHAAVAQTEDFIAECIEAWDGDTRRPYAIAFKDDPLKPVGMLDARIGPHMVEIGYVIARSYWGKGLMPEAICVLAEKVLSSRRFFRIQASCDVENRASARALEKSGFVREARLRRYMVHPNMSPEPRPCFMYARCR